MEIQAFARVSNTKGLKEVQTVVSPSVGSVRFTTLRRNPQEASGPGRLSECWRHEHFPPDGFRRVMERDVQLRALQLNKRRPEPRLNCL